MTATILEKKENKFQSTLEYLGEYRGVTEAVIFDNQGLVVGRIDKGDFKAEIFSPLTLLMLEQINAILSRLNEDQVQSLVIKTVNSWITLCRIHNLFLAVNAKSETDELLKVRIGQAVEMIKTTLTNNYPL